MARMFFVVINCSIALLLLESTRALARDSDGEVAECGKYKGLKHELFATKTTYEEAREYLKKLDDDELPNSFDEDKLEKEHNELKKDGCVPLVFYFIGRHSARFPDGEDIEKYNKDLYGLIDKMNASSGRSDSKCQRQKGEFLRWRSKMVAKQDNLITHLGGREERDIARRFKRIYPEFFDTQKADIRIGVTNKIRTAQTGAEFLRDVQGLEGELVSRCEERTTPTNDVDRSDYNLDKVLEAACYKYLIDKYRAPFLEFHKQCEQLNGGEKIKDERIERVKNPRLKRGIADKVARRLGLETGSVTPDLLESVFNMCRFENAMKNDSIWCELFDERDAEALEYMEDVSSYFKSAYGPKSNPRQSCPLVADLLEAVRAGTQMPMNAKRRSYLYFSHADPIKKLLATFELFKDDESFSERRLIEFERTLSVPKKRAWRTSIITPFSANLAFILYRCPNGKGHKIIATVTEQPVRLGGCKVTDCSTERFFRAYDSLRQCDLTQVCNRNRNSK